MHLTCLDFVPSEEQLALMKRALKGSRNASGDLAFEYDIVYLPELDAWSCIAVGNQHVEDYRGGYVSAYECLAHFPTKKKDRNGSALIEHPRRKSHSGTLLANHMREASDVTSLTTVSPAH
jgi:hypothetical protein